MSSLAWPNLSCIPSCPFVWLIHAKGTQITHLRPLEPLQCIQNNKKSFKSCALNPVNRCLLIGLLIHWPLGLLACWTKGQLVVGLLVHWLVVMLFVCPLQLFFCVFLFSAWRDCPTSRNWCSKYMFHPPKHPICVSTLWLWHLSVTLCLIKNLICSSKNNLTLTTWKYMREIRLYEGSDSGSKGSRCGNYGLNETDLEGRKGIYHNFGQFGPFGQQPNKG